PPREDPPLLRQVLQRQALAAARLGGQRGPRGLPLPARLDRALRQPGPVRGPAAPGGLRRGQRAGPVPVGRGLAGGGAMKLVVAVGGASGSIYAKRLLDVLVATPGDREVGLCFSKSGQEVWKHEIGSEPS